MKFYLEFHIIPHDLVQNIEELIEIVKKFSEGIVVEDLLILK